MSQELADASECDATDELRATYGVPCYSSPYDLDPDQLRSWERDESKVDRAGAETQWFLMPSSLTDVRVKIRELEEKKWARQATQRLEVAFPTYNAIEGTVTVTYIHIFVNRGGHFWKQVVMASVHLNLFRAGIAAYIVDGIWILLTLRILLSELFDVMSHFCQLGIVKGFVSYCNIWNLVDWISVGGAAGIYVCYYFQMMKTSELQKDLEIYDNRIPGGFKDITQTAGMMAKIEDAVEHARWTRIVVAFYALVIGLRLFKACAAQPRLALVTMTISNAAVDIIHFGFVFFATIAIFAASAMMLFGHELQSFSTFARSFGATLRCLLGDFNWPELEEIGRGLAGAWFWSFQILAVNIMFNMMLAIVIDAYAAVKAATVNAETLWSQTYEIWHRWWEIKAGRAIGLNRVAKALLGGKDLAKEQTDHDLYNEVTAEDLCKEVQGLQMPQAISIVEGALTMLHHEKEEVTLEQTMERITSVEKKANVILKGQEAIIDAIHRPNGASITEKQTTVPPKTENIQLQVDGAEASLQLDNNFLYLYRAMSTLQKTQDANNIRLGGLESKLDKLIDQLAMSSAVQPSEQFRIESRPVGHPGLPGGNSSSWRLCSVNPTTSESCG